MLGVQLLCVGHWGMHLRPANIYLASSDFSARRLVFVGAVPSSTRHGLWLVQQRRLCSGLVSSGRQHGTAIVSCNSSVCAASGHWGPDKLVDAKCCSVLCPLWQVYAHCPWEGRVAWTPLPGSRVGRPGEAEKNQSGLAIFGGRSCFINEIYS